MKRKEPPSRHRLLNVLHEEDWTYTETIHGGCAFERISLRKWFAVDASIDPKVVAPWVNRIKALAQLSCRKIAEVYDLGQVDGDWYVQRHFEVGTPLAALVTRLSSTGEPMAPPTAAQIGRRLGAALAYGHAMLNQGHGGLHAGNVILSYSGAIVLTDWATSRRELAGVSTGGWALPSLDADVRAIAAITRDLVDQHAAGPLWAFCDACARGTSAAAMTSLGFSQALAPFCDGDPEGLRELASRIAAADTQR